MQPIEHIEKKQVNIYKFRLSWRKTIYKLTYVTSYRIRDFFPQQVQKQVIIFFVYNLCHILEKLDQTKNRNKPNQTLLLHLSPVWKIAF